MRLVEGLLRAGENPFRIFRYPFRALESLIDSAAGGLRERVGERGPGNHRGCNGGPLDERLHGLLLSESGRFSFRAGAPRVFGALLGHCRAVVTVLLWSGAAALKGGDRA